MAKNDFDTQALLQFIEGSVGKTLADIAQEFGVSIRTVQRRIRELRTRYSGLDIRETQVGDAKAFRYLRRGITVGMGVTARDIVTLHRLRLAANVFRNAGMVAHAETLQDHVEALTSTMPRAHRQAVERQLQRLSNMERVKSGTKKPQINRTVVEALQLASLAEREVSATLRSGVVLKGTVESIRHTLEGHDVVRLRLSDGVSRTVAMEHISCICGVNDLLRHVVTHA